MIRAIGQGDEKAFRQLVESYQSRVLHTCLGFFPNLQDAEDLTQEVFVEVWQKIGEFRGEAALGTWLYRIAVNKSLEKIRHRRRRKRIAFFTRLAGLDDPDARSLSDDCHHPGLLLEQQERGAILFRHLDKLPENQRAAIVLQKMEGLSQSEIAEVLQVSDGAVESLLFRAKKNLHNLLLNYYKNESI